MSNVLRMRAPFSVTPIVGLRYHSSGCVFRASSHICYSHVLVHFICSFVIEKKRNLNLMSVTVASDQHNQHATISKPDLWIADVVVQQCRLCSCVTSL